MYFRYVQVAFLCMYLEVLSHLTADLKELRNDVSRLSSGDACADVQSLIVRKWLIRDRVKVTNHLFGTAVLLIYATGFLWCLLTVHTVSVNSVSNVMLMLWILDRVLIATELFLAARRGSTIVRLCHSTELRLVRHRNPPSAEDARLFSAIQFRPDCDTLTIGGLFPNQTTSVLQGLFSCCTLACIVLQFDFNFVAELNRLADSVRGSF